MAIQHQAYRRGENFPVASRLLPSVARKPILALYDFARGADEIADHPHLPSGEREAALLALRQALDNQYRNQLPPWAMGYYEAISQLRLNAKHGRELLEAFLQDTRINRYANLHELLAYCALSAAPVGRAVLELCEEKEADREASDALCITLQLLNHAQDAKADYQRLNRVYLPTQWLYEADITEDALSQDRMNEGLRQVYDRLLDYCAGQMTIAARLPSTIHSPRLRTEVVCILNVASALIRQLRIRDALAARVALTPAQKIGCLMAALPALWRRR